MTEERAARPEVAPAEPAEVHRMIEEALQSLDRSLGVLEDCGLEQLCREKPACYSPNILRRVRLVDHERLCELVEDALDAGRILPDERSEVLRADVVIEGLLEGKKAYVLIEASSTVTAHDIRRACIRAELLQRATGLPVLPAVAGRSLARDPETLQEAARVWRVLDGKTEPPA